MQKYRPTYYNIGMNGSVGITKLFPLGFAEPPLEIAEAMQPLFLPEYPLTAGNDTSSPPSSQYFAAINRITMYYTPLLIVTGTVGNILTCVTLSRGPMARLSANPYLLALCVSDTCFLQWMLLHWLKSIRLGFFLVGLGGLCQGLIFSSYVCTFTATWIIVCLSVDRFIVINLPSRFARLASPVRARITSIVVTIVAIVVYLNISVLYAESHSKTERGLVIELCYPLPRFLHAVQVLSWVDMFMNHLIPHLAIALLSLATLCALVGHFRRRNVMIRTNDSRSRTVNLERRPKAEMQCTKLTLSICCAFLCLNLPSGCLRLYASFSLLGRKGSGLGQLFMLCQKVFLLMLPTRSALNFPLHYVSHRTFRRAFKARFCGKQSQKYVPSRKPSTSSRIMIGLNKKSSAGMTII